MQINLPIMNIIWDGFINTQHDYVKLIMGLKKSDLEKIEQNYYSALENSIRKLVYYISEIKVSLI